MIKGLAAPFLIAAALSSPAKACLPLPPDVAFEDAEAIVIGKYFSEGSEDRGWVYLDTNGDLRWDARYAIRWNRQRIEAGEQSECGSPIPSHGSQGQFFLSRVSDSEYEIVLSRWHGEQIQISGNVN